MARRKATFVENREGLRPGDACKTCGAPLVALARCQVGLIEFDLTGCETPTCKGVKRNVGDGVETCAGSS